MEPIQIFIIVIVLGGFYLFLLCSSISTYFEKMKLVRTLRKVPTSKIQDVKSGYVEIKGKLCDSEEKFISPVSKTPCLYYQIRVQQKVTKCRGIGKRRRCHSHWKTILNDRKSNIIKVQDEVGTIMVNIPEASINLISDFQDNISTFNPAEEKTKDFMKNDLNIKNVEGIFRGDYRLSEAYLVPGDSIYAIGKAYEIDGELCIGKDTLYNNPFIVSDKSEKVLSHEYRGTAINNLLAIIGLLALPIAAAIFFYHA